MILFLLGPIFKKNEILRFLTFSFIFIAFLPVKFSAQTPICPLSKPELQILHDQLLSLHLSSKTTERGGFEHYVPVKIFSISDDSMSKRSETNILQLFCRLNEIFSPVGVRFYLKDDKINHIVDKKSSHLQYGVGEQNILSITDSAAINLIIVSEIQLSNDPSAITLSVPVPSKKWVLLSSLEVNIPSNSAGHSFGHYLSLAHPCHGWELTPWAKGDTTCAPKVDQFGQEIEKLDGSNSLVSGDMIADTPPDYNFIEDDTNCLDGYNGGAKDPNCMPLKGLVQMDNLMSYYECPGKLTIGQGDAMIKWLDNPFMDYLDNNYLPPADEIIVPSDFMVEPTANAQTPFNNQFYFKWDKVADATFYVLEIASSYGFNDIIYTELTAANEVYVQNLSMPSNVSRFWRVTPYNSFATCTTPPPVRKFITGKFAVATHEPNAQNWTLEVFPNPGRIQENPVLFLETKNSFQGDIEINSMDGKQLYFEKGHAFPAGKSGFIVPLKNFTSGVCTVSIRSQLGVVAKKWIVFEQ